MEQSPYPSGTVRQLLKTSYVTPKTKDVLEARIAENSVLKPSFFDAASFAILQAVSDRLIPQSHGVDLAGALDR
ncbi:MAG: gluconate 2-dehydrogenase subunit 3 family protein, partial [Phormidesmis sp. CAN_BIN44]|nr:gluconate 2-dehydrogenase subunit 3 family protein [Phormidesmis sp. CAN_BIN44]